MTTLIRREMDATVSILTMDKAPHNLIDGKFLDQFCAELEASVEDGARSILIRSDLRHFCAGADVSSLTSDAIDSANSLKRIESIPIPTVAAIHGAALGGGFELALTCDLIIAAETAKIGSVEVGIGLAPLLGAIQRLVALAGPARAREITMLGRRYSPDVLERWGVINMVVPDAELVSASLSLARQLGAGPTVAIGAIKRIVQIASDEGTRAADEALDKELSDMWSSNDVKVGMEAMKNTGPGTAIFEGK